MARRVFTALSVLSLVILVCVLLAWRGSWLPDRAAPRGSVGVQVYWGYDGRYPYYTTVSRRGWFTLYRETRARETRRFVAPYWAAAVLTAIMPAAWLRRLLRKRRPLQANCCPACSYNLTGNTSGVCPECGTPTTAGVKA